MKLVRFLLFPFAILYDLITTVRNVLFDVHFFKSTSFKIPVIVVGNLSVGGTGKTPQIEYLMRLLKDTYSVSILSRGYKRKTKGFVLVNENHTASDVGDEPLQYFKKFKNSSVAVDENRVEGITKLITEKSPEIVLLDDAYQHRKVKGSFYILLTKYDDLFTDDFLLPTGNLRESSTGAQRANIILITKCPSNLKKEHKEKIKNKIRKYNKIVFFTSISYADKISGSYEISIENLQNFEVLLITGIANPGPLLDFLDKKNIRFIHLKYADHHHFSSKEIEEVQENFKSIKTEKKLILTTEKDYTRLSSKLENLSFLEIETSFIADKSKFDAIIKEHIQQK
jgi:tetraacyldisaccharide 4'-kinase